MKKLSILLSLILLGGAFLTSCDDEQVLPPITYPDGANGAGTGTWNDPYHIWQVLEGKDNGKDSYGQARDAAWTTGYIVGYIMDGPTFDASTSVFSAEGAGTSNILLAESVDETNYEKCVPVQLSNIRNAVNLKDHPDNLGQQITIKGSLEKYFGKPGIKSCSEYNWGPVGLEEDEPEPAPEPQPVPDTPTQKFLENGLGDFTIENVVIPSQISKIWTWDSQYGAKASAFANNTKYASDSYLISPAITLGKDTRLATFDQAANKFDKGKPSDYFSVCVREGTSGAWTTIQPSAWPAGNSWNFTDGCQLDLSAYSGKTIQIAFRYTSTTESAGTWELKNLYIY